MLETQFVAVVKLLSCPVLLRPPELQHSRLPWPSLSPWVCSNSCSLSQWCLLTISASVTPFSSFPQSSPPSGSFRWVGTSHKVAKGLQFQLQHQFFSMNIQGWFPLGLTGLISLQSKGLSRVFTSTTVRKHQFFSAQPSLWSSSQIRTWLLEKTITLTIRTFVSKVMS